MNKRSSPILDIRKKSINECSKGAEKALRDFSHLIVTNSEEDIEMLTDIHSMLLTLRKIEIKLIARLKDY